MNPLNPRTGTNPLIDSLIGNAYEVVKYVAYYVKEIRYVAHNMEHVFRVSEKLYQNVLQVETILTLDSEITIALPEGVTTEMVIGNSVLVKATDGSIHGPGDAFTWTLDDTELTVAISGDAPTTFVGAQIRWLLNWQSPIQVG